MMSGLCSVYEPTGVTVFIELQVFTPTWTVIQSVFGLVHNLERRGHDDRDLGGYESGFPRQKSANRLRGS